MPIKGGKSEILIDTSVIIGYLRGNEHCLAAMREVFDNKSRAYINSIVLMELLMGAYRAPEVDKAVMQVEKLTKYFEPVISFDETHSATAARIYNSLIKKNQVIEIRDILIASSALMMNIPVMTLNIKHFKRIAELKVIHI